MPGSGTKHVLDASSIDYKLFDDVLRIMFVIDNRHFWIVDEDYVLTTSTFDDALARLAEAEMNAIHQAVSTSQVAAHADQWGSPFQKRHSEKRVVDYSDEVRVHLFAHLKVMSADETNRFR
jgi:hypothetical protein